MSDDMTEDHFLSPNEIEPAPPDNREREECQFPGRCLMPGDHLSSECHTVEMVEQYNRDRIRGLP
jgi:hypothetical protein